MCGGIVRTACKREECCTGLALPGPPSNRAQPIRFVAWPARPSLRSDSMQTQPASPHSLPTFGRSPRQSQARPLLGFLLALITAALFASCRKAPSPPSRDRLRPRHILRRGAFSWHLNREARLPILSRRWSRKADARSGPLHGHRRAYGGGSGRQRTRRRCASRPGTLTCVLPSSIGWRRLQ